MTNIIFICHGNICRSTMAEFVFRDLCEKKGVSHKFNVCSAGTSNEEEGNPVHYGTRRKLNEHGISCNGKYARQMDTNDLKFNDYIVIMDRANYRNVMRFASYSKELNEVVSKKVFTLLSFAGKDGDIADPWYTGNFDQTWDDVLLGCTALLEHLNNEGLC